MRLKEEFALAEAEKAERAKAAKSVASTPKVAGVGAPTPRAGGMMPGPGRTPRRRFGF